MRNGLSIQEANKANQTHSKMLKLTLSYNKYQLRSLIIRNVQDAEGTKEKQHLNKSRLAPSQV